MSTNRSFESLAGRIALEDLTAHMLKLGWQRASGFGSRRQTFIHPEMEGLDIILPTNSKYLGSEKSIYDTLSALSQIHNITLTELAADIVSDHADSMLIRLEIPDHEFSIPVEDAPRHVKAIRNLILYSASSEIDAKPYYDDIPSGAISLIKNFDFCHTFKGSFGFEISSSMSKSSKTLDLFEPPSERKIIERVARGLSLLGKAVEFNEPGILLNSYDTALNSKMCDAIAEISLDGRMRYDIEIEWASCIAPSEDIATFRTRRIAEPEVEMLHFVSEQLKIVTPKADEISGHVVNLHCVDNPSKDTSRRTISTRTNHDKHGKIEVRMQLGPEFYLKAVSAHSSGLKILAKGQLQRKGGSWTLDAITTLELIGSAADI
ncbi:hypothetical protein [Pseudomonas sp. Gutcm_11s]|uniref:hypothetical protein n=1 Tax=Pseudomonas sp. Gutcm_11s TaxID=3026088 RepID=UPI0023616CA5|nr:hypothetical protein [Pseudomonas sp. Gutcm_11s]MDD0841776.1 hypothetical protein [Pseudomonas sp. Gutcm_11s]